MAKRKMRIVWTCNEIFDKEEFAFYLYNYKETVSGDIQIAIMPLDDLERERADHEAQLREAAYRLAELGHGTVTPAFDDKGISCKSTFANWLKYLHSIRAKDVTR
jgi:hypothetical protein